MKQNFFPEGNPIGKLYIETMPHEILKQRFLNGVELDHDVFHETRKLVQHAFPETYINTANRIHDACTELRNMYKYADKKTAHIVVTHGANVNTFNERFAQVKASQIDYCGISAVTLKGRSARMQLSGVSKYVLGTQFDEYTHHAKKRNLLWEKPALPEPTDDKEERKD